MPLGTVPFVILAVVRYHRVARRHPERDAGEIAFRDPIAVPRIVGFPASAVTLLAGA